jgi:N-terminal domain of galactosyltransferase/Glycosyl transferase family 2
MRRWLGVLLLDWPRYQWLLVRKPAGYLGLANRGQSVIYGPSGVGALVPGLWTSELHAASVMPMLGKQVLARALSDHPVRLQHRSPVCAGTCPKLTVLIGHRGMARLPLLLKTLESFAAQDVRDFEVIVIEQDCQSRISAVLPSWVRHLLTPPANSALPYSRSWSFNVGAQAAQGEVLILHDNDMLVPTDYISGILDRIREGAQVVNAKRFVLYMSQRATEAVCAGSDSWLAEPPISIVQNALGGGSVAITHQAFLDIGGMDESFVGWGGEDNEFWDRAQTLKIWNFGWLSLVHLWHAAQPGKQDLTNPTLARLDALLQIPATERIAALKAGAGQATLGDVIDLGYGQAG